MSTVTELFVIPLALSPGTEPQQQVAALWSRLADFGAWPQWLPYATSVERLDEGAVGRGSRLRVRTEFTTERWIVSYWDAGKRVVFQIHCNSQRRACAIETRYANQDLVHVVLELEFELLGWRRFVRPLVAQIYARRARRIAAALESWLQNPGE